jgi:hypothetical protein
MDEGWHDVHLLQLPVQIHGRASTHLEALAREFAIIRFGQQSDSVPARVAELARQLEVDFSGLGEEQNQRLREAVAEGRTAIDITYRVPAAWAQACVVILAMLEEVDEFCRRGDLVTLATPQEAVHYRRWVFGEFIRQVEGADPLPWPEYVGSVTEPDGAADAGAAPRR